jgi:hypothetical protein
MNPARSNALHDAARQAVRSRPEAALSYRQAAGAMACRTCRDSTMIPPHRHDDTASACINR